MVCGIDEIDTIDDGCREALAAKGITNTNQLFKRCETAKGRAELARVTGLKEADLLRWVLLVDLLCLPELGKGYLNLLCAAGVHSIEHMRAAEIDDLMARLAAAKAGARNPKKVRMPSKTMARGWIAHARAVRSTVG
jgi:hypothetical protein